MNEFRQLPDFIDWRIDRERCEVKLLISPDDLDAWAGALDSCGALFCGPNYGGLEPALSDGHSFPEGGRIW